MKQKQLIIGIGGHVLAIDRTTGNEIWRRKLKGSDMVTVELSDDQVFAGAGGEIFGIDPNSGTILWRNKLKGLGLGLVSFAGNSGVAAGAKVVQQRQGAGAAVVT